MRRFCKLWAAGSLALLGACDGPRPSVPSSPTARAEPTVPPQPAVSSPAAAPPASATPLASSAPPPPPPEPPPVVVKLELEPPYKLNERVEPTTMETWWAQFREHRMWNQGALGELLGEPPGPEGHPDPRVIVNVDKVKGPRDAEKVQRTARKYHWINVVRCYRLGAYKDAELRGWTHARMVISSGGAVLRPKLLKTELEDDAVAKCVVDKLRTLKLGRSAKSSEAWVRVRVGPGDDPMPPPDDLLVPGDGVMAVEKMRAGVEAGQAAFETCYRAALSYAPGLWGRIMLRFHVTDQGVLDEAYETGSHFPDARVRQCVERAARKLKFPRPKDGDIRFIAPIRFSNSRSQIGDPNVRKPPPEAP